jgi:hypothetical protein
MQFGVAAVTSMFLSDFINKRIQSRVGKLLVVIVSSLLPATTYLLNDPKEFFVKTPNSALGRDSRAAIRVLMAANSGGTATTKHPVVTAFARFYPEAAREEADSEVSPALLAEIDKIVADIMLKKLPPARVPDAADSKSDEAPRLDAPTPVALRSSVSSPPLSPSPSALSKAATSSPVPAPPMQHYDDDDDFYESSPPATSTASAGDRKLKSGGNSDRLRALEEKFHGRQPTSASASTSAGSAAPAAGRANAPRTAGSGAGSKPRAPFPPVDDDADEYVDPWAEPPPRAVRPAAGAGASGSANGRKPFGSRARDGSGSDDRDW